MKEFNPTMEIHIVNLLITHPTEKKILAVKRAPHDKTFGGMYSLPGGKIDEGESVEEAARRELLEETGGILKSMAKAPFILSPLEVRGKIYNIGLFTAEIEIGSFESQDKDIESVEFIEPQLLLDSLQKHNYPQAKIEILRNFFLDDNYL